MINLSVITKRAAINLFIHALGYGLNCIPLISCVEDLIPRTSEGDYLEVGHLKR